MKFAMVLAAAVLPLSSLPVYSQGTPKVGAYVELHAYGCSTRTKALEMAYLVEKARNKFEDALNTSNSGKKHCGEIKGMAVVFESKEILYDRYKKEVEVSTLSSPQHKGVVYFATYLRKR